MQGIVSLNQLIGAMSAVSSRSRLIYTIGHSSHDLEDFIALLRANGITAVADVRSSPFSRRHPQFNRPELKAALNAAGIAYVFLGDQVGARPKDRSCYRAGRAEYGLIADSEAFQEGLRRIEEGAERYSIALMCAEKEPLDCHRTILIARHLQRRGTRIVHILADGTTEPNPLTERRLLKQMHLEAIDLFIGPRTEQEALEAAYDRRGDEIYYVEQANSVAENLADETPA
jgi:uncharacterized protein (DUF488 family)